MNESNTETVTEAVDEITESVVNAIGSQADFTPYQAAGVASKVLGRRVREQMLYNYVSKGYIPSQDGERTTNKGVRVVRVILAADLQAWLVKFASKQASK